jgi:hypothetical protein
MGKKDILMGGNLSAKLVIFSVTMVWGSETTTYCNLTHLYSLPTDAARRIGVNVNSGSRAISMRIIHTRYRCYNRLRLSTQVIYE